MLTNYDWILLIAIKIQILGQSQNPIGNHILKDIQNDLITHGLGSFLIHPGTWIGRKVFHFPFKGANDDLVESFSVGFNGLLKGVQVGSVQVLEILCTFLNRINQGPLVMSLDFPHLCIMPSVHHRITQRIDGLHFS